ncbi:MAG: hypothetical protein ABIR59_00070 [Gemmatimonadales bacterium]
MARPLDDRIGPPEGSPANLHARQLLDRCALRRIDFAPLPSPASVMNLDDIKAHLDRIFATRPGSTREQAAMLREALLEFKVGIGQLQEGLRRTESDLERARDEVTVYTRRGIMAADIGDDETRAVAEEFLTKSRERVDLLERKVVIQRDELFLAERDYAATRERFQAARLGVNPPSEPGLGSLDDDVMAPSDQFQLDQRAREAAVDAQLDMLKQKLRPRS